MLFKVSILVEDFNIANSVIAAIESRCPELIIVSVEHNGAIGLKQINYLKPELIILDSKLIPLGVNKFLYPILSNYSKFNLILLDDNDADIFNYPNISSVIKPDSINNEIFVEALNLAVDKLKEQDKIQPEVENTHETLRAFLENRNKSLNKEINPLIKGNLNLRQKSSIFIAHPVQGASHFNLTKINERLKNVLKRYYGGETFQNSEGDIFVILNTISNNNELMDVSTINMIVGEMKSIVENEFGAYFYFCLSESFFLPELKNSYITMLELIEYSYFLKEKDVLMWSDVKRKHPIQITDLYKIKCDELSEDIFNNNFFNFERHISEFFLWNLKQSLDFKAVEILRTKLKNIYYTVAIAKGLEVNEKHFNRKFDFIEDELSDMVFIFSELLSVLQAMPHKSNIFILRTIMLMLENYSSGVSLQWISDKLELSNTYLSHLFKKEMGINFIDCLTGIRVEKSKALLNDKKYKISEVSQMLGFSDLKYFSRIFKNATGITPSEYRNLNL